ncbi:hypothetical protein [Paraurantiacibacter namhicola]|uniref:Uncharacterized protein n=1 Tax=Paraurantiacibacter namhicola TaxID=645517 RepID=A0A1C7D872_9SPHN|nr:hypothetical protein [Paraurantiacibacter namhicola]ANU07674.1 hypothetical protein A6F65_01368 [Paraurantiacibacter namhicola]
MEQINEFQYIFELFTLLISLAVAEMLLGFSRILKLRARRKAGVDPAARKVKVGWLVPLLGLLVLVDLGTFWNIVWITRDVLDMQMATVFGVLILIGGYYLVATLVFPDEPELWPDFDAYYWLQKRFVVWGMFAINVAAQVAIALLGATPSAEEQGAILAQHPWFLLAGIFIFLSMPAFVWLALSKGRRTNIALMLFIIFVQFFYALTAWGIEGLF